MTRVLEIVLSFHSPEVLAGSETRSSRSRRTPRDFGAELVRAWRIFPQVRMRRGHEHVTVRRADLPAELAAAPNPREGDWQAWHEVTARAARTRLMCGQPLVAGVTAYDLHQLGEAIVPDDAPGFVCERRLGNWQEADGRSVEIVLDQVEPEHADSPLHGYELRLSVRDAVAGDSRIVAVRLLFAVARELCSAWPAFVQPAGAYALVAASGILASRPPPLRAEPIRDVVLDTQREAFLLFGVHVANQWFGNLHGAHTSPDPEYIHQLRVALRRLRTLARLFPRYADAAWKASFDADLRWFGERLGAARDWDVFLESTLPALIAADAGYADWSSTQAAARARCAAARAELQRAIACDRYTRFSLSWLEWLCVFSLEAGGDDIASLRRHAEKRIGRLFERVNSAPRLSTLDLPACHQVRIDAKRLRYALEFFVSLIDRRTRDTLLKPLARIQSALGDANDLEVGLQRLAELEVSPYQTGFARGYAAAMQYRAVRDAEQWLGMLNLPRFGRGGR